MGAMLHDMVGCSRHSGENKQECRIEGRKLALACLCGQGLHIGAQGT